MAYDGRRGRTVLFGGAQDFGQPTFTDTWEWDGSRWRQLTTTGPSGNHFHRMAFDARRSRTVSFGGRGGGGETWEWDGRTWTKMASSGPPPRDHHALAAQLVAHHDGQVVKVERDGFMASFNSAHGGLHCGVELQRTFPGGADGSVTLRVGLHSGFVIANPEQLLGRNVVLAARIASHAAGGELLVSSSVKEYTEGDPRFRFEPRGEYHFKGLLGEHDVYAVAWRQPEGA